MPLPSFLKTLLPQSLFPDAPPEKLPKASKTLPSDTPRAVKQDADHACPAYTKLKANFRDVGRMNAIIETLGRDFLTAMPAGAYSSRLGHIAFLHRRLHEDLTSADMRKLLDQAQDHEYAHSGAWDEWDRANLREMSHQYRMHCCVSPELMEKKARLAYAGRRHHSALKKTQDWDTAKGFLTEQIDLHRRIAEARCETFGEDSHYQMLMQEHMPSVTTRFVDKVFAQHKAAVDGLLPRIIEKQLHEPSPASLDTDFDADAQMWLNRSLLRVLGFDFKRGGLYETGHNPVEGGTPEDTRLVISNVDAANFLTSMKSAMHEGGHGLYIQGLPRHEWRYQPVAQDLGAAIHESQALLVEMIIGRTLEFFEFLSPRIEGLFQGMNAPALSPENLFALKTRVQPTVDRKGADEVTYFYHVLLRYELERGLIEGSVNIDKLPELWVELTHNYLGVEPVNHLQGCLQDVHWFVGKFGYFPSYVLGHMLGAQFYYTLQKDVPSMDADIANGDFKRIVAWLRDNIYSKGRLLPPQTLIKQATGETFNPAYLEKHLRARYLQT